jgi:hypothetical protein
LPPIWQLCKKIGTIPETKLGKFFHSTSSRKFQMFFLKYVKIMYSLLTNKHNFKNIDFRYQEMLFDGECGYPVVLANGIAPNMTLSLAPSPQPLSLHLNI